MHTTSASTRLTTRFGGITTVLALVASLAFIAPAGATHDVPDDPPLGVDFVRERADGTEIWNVSTLFFYDNTTGDSLEYVALVGGDLYDICGLRPGDPDALVGSSRYLVKERANGIHLVKSPPAGHDTYVSVYRADVPPPVLFGQVCGDFFENGTPIPPPFATGFATLQHKSWVADPIEVMDPFTPQPIGRYRNGAVGVVADAGGNQYDFETVAVFRVRDPQGIPDFTTMTTSLTPIVG